MLTQTVTDKLILTKEMAYKMMEAHKLPRRIQKDLELALAQEYYSGMYGLPDKKGDEVFILNLNKADAERGELLVKVVSGSRLNIGFRRPGTFYPILP